MALPILALLGGTALGLLTEKFIGGGSGGSSGGGGTGVSGGFLEIATSKKYETKKDMSTYAPTTTHTTTTSNVRNIAYDYNPKIIISSPMSTQSSKKELGFSVPQIVTPTITPTVTPIQAESLGGGSGGMNIFEELKPLLLIGGVGFAVYHIFIKKKARAK